MPNTLLIKEVTDNLRANFKKHKCVQSAYLYGSILTNDYSVPLVKTVILVEKGV